MNKSNLVHVATFGAAIGLKGEIKVNLLTSTIDVFRLLDQYYNFDQSIKWNFESVVMRQEKCVALPSHCKNREDAEALKNQKIFSFKENFPSINPIGLIEGKFSLKENIFWFFSASASSRFLQCDGSATHFSCRITTDSKFHLMD